MTVNCNKPIHTRNNGLLPSLSLPSSLRFPSSIKNDLLMLLLGRQDCKWSLSTTTQWQFCLVGLAEHLSFSPYSSTKHFSGSGNELCCSKRPNLSSTVSRRTITSTPATRYLRNKCPRRFWESGRGKKGKTVLCQPHLREKVLLWPKSGNQFSCMPVSKMHHKPPDDLMSPVSFLHPVSD